MIATGLLLLWSGAIPARADAVIFSNLGPGNSYGSTGRSLGDPGDGDYVTLGNAFTVGATSMNLSEIEVAAGLMRGTNQLTIDLDADSGGSPGAVIESFTIKNAMPGFGTVSMNNLVTATSVLHPLLTAGTQYWVVLSVPDDGLTWAAWNLNSTGDTGPVVISHDGVMGDPQTITRGAMEILGQSSVPEPSTLVMLGTSGVVLLAFGRGRRGRSKSA
jgi:PEP-CTERM motif